MEKVYFELIVKGTIDHALSIEDAPEAWSDFTENIHAACEAVGIKVTWLESKFEGKEESLEEWDGTKTVKINQE